IPPALAARWMTMSWPRTALAHAVRTRRSNWLDRGTKMSRGRAPRSTSIRTTGRPRNPAPPVTRIFFPENPETGGSGLERSRTFFTVFRLRVSEAGADGEALRGEDPAPLARRGQPRLLHVRVHHDPDELLERHLRLPPEEAPGLRGIADQVLDLGGAEIFRVDLHVPP